MGGEKNTLEELLSIIKIRCGETEEECVGEPTRIITEHQVMVTLLGEIF